MQRQGHDLHCFDVTVDEPELVAGLDGAGAAGADASCNVTSAIEGNVTFGPLSSVTADGEASVTDGRDGIEEASMTDPVPASLPGEAAPFLRCGGVYLPTPEVDDLTDRRSGLLLSESEEVE